MNTGFTGPRHCWAHAFALVQVWFQRKAGIEWVINIFILFCYGSLFGNIHACIP